MSKFTAASLNTACVTLAQHALPNRCLFALMPPRCFFVNETCANRPLRALFWVNFLVQAPRRTRRRRRCSSETRKTLCNRCAMWCASPKRHRSKSEPTRVTRCDGCASGPGISSSSVSDHISLSRSNVSQRGLGYLRCHRTVRPSYGNRNIGAPLPSHPSRSQCVDNSSVHGVLFGHLSSVVTT